mmetsp:Transcript_4914/g.7280  ORF Transcript_4914/g.7280 Transcript_4914/m.7280 type:complete len:94 (+) Transcript_4914:56-337(+)
MYITIESNQIKYNIHTNEDESILTIKKKLGLLVNATPEQIQLIVKADAEDEEQPSETELTNENSVAAENIQQGDVIYGVILEKEEDGEEEGEN